MTTKTELLEIIRAKCLECCGDDPDEVKMCSAGPNDKAYYICPLWEFRDGKDPTPQRKCNIPKKA